jgi:hypothetical protein
MSGVMDGVLISSNVSKMLDACVIAFKSITELCMTGDKGEFMFGEG